MKIGDVVVLKSGSTKMTVVDISPYYDQELFKKKVFQYNIVRTIWMTKKNEIERGNFRQETLKIWGQEDIKSPSS